MKRFLLSLLIVLSTGCGKGHLINPGSVPGRSGGDGFFTVTQMMVCVGNDLGCSELNAFYRALDFLNPISSAFAALAPTATITYTNNLTGTMTLAVLPTVDETDPSMPNFGTLNVNAYDTNDLKKCGPLLNQRCSQAIIRAYVSARSVNFVDNGAIVLIDGLEIDDGVANATTLLTGAIAGNQNRIRTSPAGQNVFAGSENNLGDLELDLNNAHYGNYSATIVIELAIGPI